MIQYAYESWQQPAPRYVLLVGDASWDPYHPGGEDERYADWTYRRGETVRFTKNKSTQYERPPVDERDLVPTFYATTREGYAASDNGFVTLVGEDFFPDLAIGRFPVTSPDEVRAIVEKTIRYKKSKPDGEWRKAVLFHYQRR